MYLTFVWCVNNAEGSNHQLNVPKNRRVLRGTIYYFSHCEWVLLSLQSLSRSQTQILFAKTFPLSSQRFHSENLSFITKMDRRKKKWLTWKGWVGLNDSRSPHSLRVTKNTILNYAIFNQQFLNDNKVTRQRKRINHCISSMPSADDRGDVQGLHLRRSFLPR